MVKFLILWKISEKIGKNWKFHVIVGTKKSGVSPVLELKNLESVHLWNQEIRSPSTFRTKFEGFSPFLELKNPDSVWYYSYKRNWIDSRFLGSRNGLTPLNLVTNMERLRILLFQRWTDSRFFQNGLTPSFLVPTITWNFQFFPIFSLIFHKIKNSTIQQ